MSKHSKGPFRLRIDEQAGVEVRDARGLPVAWFGLSWSASAKGTEAVTLAEAKANARLFVRAAKAKGETT